MKILVVLAVLVPSTLALAIPPNPESDLSTYVIPGAHDYVKAGDDALKAGATAPVLTGELRMWRHAVYRSDFCFIGTVVDARYDCVTVEDRDDVESLAVVQYMVDEAFWGVEATTAIVDARSSRPGECVQYTFPTETGFESGRRYLVMGTMTGDRLHAYDQGTVTIRGDGLFGPDGVEIGSASETSRTLARVAERRSFRNQAQAADLVCYVTAGKCRSMGSSLVVPATVDAVLKGSDPGQSLHVYMETAPKDAGIEDFFFTPRLEPEKRYLLLLEVRPEGGFRSVYGSRSMLQLQGDELYSRRDLLWGKRELADSMVAEAR